MMLAMLGMAVGTGNIWRFPRIAATNGGGEFLVAWAICLFTWSIPLILTEFGLGRMTRLGPVGAFVRVLGPGRAWMGAFIAFVAIAIMWYYSVVTGWTLRYFAGSALGQVTGDNSVGFWSGFSRSAAPVLPHLISVALAVFIVARGVRGIERMAKVLMPTLLILVLILTIRALTLPGAADGLGFLFGVDWNRLGDASIWLNALTQNAWDTGAGWGLVLTYAAYLREKEDTALNGFILPMANNTVSLCAGMMVMCTVFSVVPALVSQFTTNPQALADFPALQQAVQAGQPVNAELVERTIFGAGNEGITFVWIPKLFATLPAGQVFMSLFFLALFFAAFTSLVSMVELGTRVLLDMGMARQRAVMIVGITGAVIGLPSAFSIDFLHNQDWVWGVGLMVSGLFFAIAIIAYGATRFRETQLNHEHSDVRIGRWWDFVIRVLVPFQAVALIIWWMYQVRGPGWLDPFGIENMGTIILQWGLAIVVLLFLNKRLARIGPVETAAMDEGRMPASVP
jgi:NSS family neurotransmitter:Na+ symporter